LKDLISVIECASISDIKQIEIHIAEPLVLGPRPLEVEIAIVNFEKYKLAGSD
jgi:hypothetical protein